MNFLGNWSSGIICIFDVIDLYIYLTSRYIYLGEMKIDIGLRDQGPDIYQASQRSSEG